MPRHRNECRAYYCQDDNIINNVLRAGKASADEVDEYAYPESGRSFL